MTGREIAVETFRRLGCSGWALEREPEPSAAVWMLGAWMARAADTEDGTDILHGARIRIHGPFMSSHEALWERVGLTRDEQEAARAWDARELARWLKTASEKVRSVERRWFVWSLADALGGKDVPIGRLLA